MVEIIAFSNHFCCYLDQFNVFIAAVSQKAGIIITIQLTDRSVYLSLDVLRTALLPRVFDHLPLLNFWDLALSSLPPAPFLPACIFFGALWLPNFISACIIVLCGVGLFSASFSLSFFVGGVGGKS